MSNDSFEFKQFKIRQDKCAMKLSTDAVLLGAWVVPNGSTSILDVGTGTGILALMLAQKSLAEITAIDIDRNSTEQARLNVAESAFSSRIRVLHTSFQNLAQSNTGKFDLIVSNPPFFVDSLKSNDDSRKLARHNDQLSFDDLLNGVKQLLSGKGKFCLILPKNEALQFRDRAKLKGLYLSKLMRIRTRADKDTEKRHLMQFEFKETEFSESTLIIEADNQRNYTEEYKALTREYYLGF
ncbi:MAG TPA: methyltransferase [Bacteroidia bacterium]|nr:methyltransferase [Bacteroidia bacterium]